MSNEIPLQFKGAKTYVAKTFCFINGRPVEAGERFTVIDMIPGKAWIPIEDVPVETPVVTDLTKPAAAIAVPLGDERVTMATKTVVPTKRPSDKPAV